MTVESGERIGSFLVLVDSSGCRHLVRVGSVQLVSDTDPCQSDTTVVVAGRPLHIPLPLDEVAVWIGDGGGRGR